MYELLDALKNAVLKGVENEKQVGLFFSGGLDSTVIGKLLSNLGIEVIPITVGTKKSEDVAFAKGVSNLISTKHIIVDIDEKIIEHVIPKVIQITKMNDVITVSVGCVIYLAAEYASKIGLNMIFTGAGSDELFAGYKSHEEALKKGYNQVQEECKRRLEGIKKDVERDKKICEHFGLKVKNPFLNNNVIKVALSIPPQDKISIDEKKIVLRKLAKEIGIPEKVYNRKKRAAQYGAGVQKIIKKLSKKEGFNSIGDYLNNIYKKQKIL